MCMSVSGRCLLSTYMTGRDSNRGQCAQPCRYQYALMEEKRPEEYFPVFEDEKGTYIMNSRDMCMIDHMKELVDAGVGVDDALGELLRREIGRGRAHAELRQAAVNSIRAVVHGIAQAFQVARRGEQFRDLQHIQIPLF